MTMPYYCTLQQSMAILEDASTMCLYVDDDNNNYDYNYNNRQKQQRAVSCGLSSSNKTVQQQQEPPVFVHKSQAQMTPFTRTTSAPISTASNAASSTSSSSAMAEEVETLLGELVNTAHILLQQERLLDKNIAEQLHLSMTRHAMGSQLGVIVCMNKVHSMRFERERVNAAIQLLEHHIRTLESQLELVTTSAQSQVNNKMLPIDIREQRNYSQQVQQILSAPI